MVSKKIAINYEKHINPQIPHGHNFHMKSYNYNNSVCFYHINRIDSLLIHYTNFHIIK